MISRNLCAAGADPYIVFPNDEKIHYFDPKIDLGLLLVQSGVFRSVKDAWRRHYRGSVPEGWQNFTVDTQQVYIYNPTDINLAPWES